MENINETQNKIYVEMAAYEKEVKEHNLKITQSIGATKQDIDILLNGSTITNKMELVKEQKGIKDDLEKNKIFKEVYVDEKKTPNGESGDYSYSGHVYGKLKKNEWLKIPFEC